MHYVKNLVMMSQVTLDCLLTACSPIIHGFPSQRAIDMKSISNSWYFNEQLWGQFFSIEL